MMSDRVPYDEFAYFADNAAEFDIAYDGPPTVRREVVAMEDGRTISSLVWGTASPELVLIHGGAQNAHTWDTVCLALNRPLIAIDMPGHDIPMPQPMGPQTSSATLRTSPRSFGRSLPWHEPLWG